MKLGPKASIGFVSTFRPTVCGIATYTASMVDAIVSHGSPERRVGVVSLADRNVGLAGTPAVFHHRVGDHESLRSAIRVLNTYDTVSVQHEFGIFAGPDGDEAVELMAGLTVPTALTLHTVLDAPSDHQWSVVQRICDLADRIVVMSETASGRLADRYGIDPRRITMIPHGVDPEFARPARARADRPLIMTWGLIGPGKGLEWAVEACAGLIDLDPLPRYLIAGSTHPQVRKDSGESYRHSLMSLAARRGVESIVEFDDRYLDRKSLARMVRTADVVVLPYESVEQVTSGVLVEAIAAAKPVVATPFPHAVELLTGGAGVVVPHGEPEALGAALRDLLADPGAMAVMAQTAHRLAVDWYWPAIGRRFADVMSQLAQDGGNAAPLTVGARRVAG